MGESHRCRYVEFRTLVEQPEPRPVKRSKVLMVLPLEEPAGEAKPPVREAFDLGEPLPPVGLKVSEAPHPGANEQSVPTAPRNALEGAAPTRRSVEITLQLDGVDPELLRVLQTLLGERFDLRALSVLLKAISIR